MLDTISYSQSNGVWTKTVTNVTNPTDIAQEISALQAQLTDFELSQETNPADEVAAAITNYQQQIAILQGA